MMKSLQASTGRGLRWGESTCASENKGRYECGGYIYSGEGQDIGQFWAKLAVGNATFTADSESMEVQIAFTFDASELGGKELVTFEELYDLSNPDEPTKVTEHKDIEDDGQTVTITEVPEMPEEPTEPEQPTTPDTPSKTTDAPKTGDNTNIALFLGLLILSGAGVAGTYFIKRRRS